MTNTNTRNKTYNVDISQKYLLTVKEAAAYFNIGETKIISLLKEYPDELLFLNGTKQLIRRKKFEDWIDKTSAC